MWGLARHFLLREHNLSNTVKRYEGETRNWNWERNFGFIEYDDARGCRRSIFYSGRNIRGDWKGSRSWAFAARIPVSFTIAHRPNNKPHAEDVASIFQMSEPEDLAAYRETSEFVSKTHDYGFLKRPCGDQLFIHLNDVIQGYKDRWDFLEIGSPVYHGARFDEGTQRWKADYIELYSYDELQSFKNEPEPEPEEEEPAPEILEPQNRNKTIVQLIAERRARG